MKSFREYIEIVEAVDNKELFSNMTPIKAKKSILEYYKSLKGFKDLEEVRLDKFKSRTYTARLITKGSSKMMDYGESYQMLFKFTIEWKETPKVELKIVNWVATYEAEYQTINVKNIYELNK